MNPKCTIVGWNALDFFDHLKWLWTWKNLCHRIIFEVKWPHRKGHVTAHLANDTNYFIDIPDFDQCWILCLHSRKCIFLVFVLRVIELNTLKTRQNKYSTLHFEVFILKEYWSFIGTHLKAPGGKRLGEARYSDTYKFFKHIMCNGKLRYISVNYYYYY